MNRRAAFERLRAEAEPAGGLLAVPFPRLSPAGRALVLRWRNEETVRRFMYDDSPVTADGHERFCAGLATDPRNLYWLVRAGEAPAGVFYLNRLDLRHGHGWLGVYKSPDPDAPVPGRDLLRAGFALAFGRLGLRTLKLEVFAANGRAVRFYEANGFRREGLLRAHALLDGAPADVLIFGILAKEADADA